MNLIQINDYAAYKDAVTEAKSNGYKRTNCYFLPNQIMQLIEKGCLYMKKMEGILLIFEDVGTFYRCYYYMGNPVGRLESDKQIVIEFPFNGTLTEEQRAQEKALLSMGFRLGCESALMYADPAVVAPKGEIDPRVVPARPQDISQVRQMLLETFDEIYAFIPSEEELLAKAEKGEVLVCRNNDLVTGVVTVGQTKRQAMMHSLVVKDRGAGLGRALVHAFMIKYRDTSNLFCHWVDIHNTPAVEYHKHFGYSFGLKRANEYIIK